MFKKISFDEYNAIKAARSSQLKSIICRSPAHSLVEKEQTAAMALGTQLHAALFEQETIVCGPKFDRRTKVGKEAAQAFADANQGKTILDEDDFALVSAMAQAINQHPEASDLLANGMCEATALWTEDFVDCKARFDFVNTEKRYIVDIKTCRDASPKGFARQVANFGYHLQAAHYLSGAYSIVGQTFDHLIIAVETEAPFAVVVYQMDFGTLEKGEALRQSALAMYRQCLATNEWPSYPTGIHSLAIPSWAFNEGEE